MIDWLKLLTTCGVRAVTAARWAPIFTRLVKPEAFSLGTRELDDWLGQVLHESGRLERLVENLNYTAPRLREVWPARFPDAASAAACAGNPQALAERVYGGRLGNVRPGDSFRYRGRGLIQVTGLANYAALGRYMGLPLVDHPELLEQPDNALLGAIAWWEGNVPDAFIGDIQRVTRAVNGGQEGLADRVALTQRAQQGLA
jgi:putative chitinase